MAEGRVFGAAPILTCRSRERRWTWLIRIRKKTKAEKDEEPEVERRVPKQMKRMSYNRNAAIAAIASRTLWPR